MMRSVLNWKGNKYRMMKVLKEYEPDHRIFVEAFAGSASYLLNKERVEKDVLNDSDEGLMNVWRIIKDEPDELIKRLDEYKFTEDMFEKEKRKFVNKEYEDCIDYALSYLILNKKVCMADMSLLKDSGRDISKEDLKNRIRENSARLKGVKLEVGDFYQVCLKYDSEDTYVFLDPPYRNFMDYRVGRFDDENYVRIRDFMSKGKSKVLLVINDHDEWLKDLFKDFQCIPVKEGRISGGKRMDEVIYINY